MLELMIEDQAAYEALASVLGQCLVRVCQIFGVLLYVSVFGAAYLLSGLAGGVDDGAIGSG